MKRKGSLVLVVVNLIVIVLLVSVVSAILVPFLSNKVTGETIVSGPIFYLDGSSVPIPPGDPESVYRNLSLNMPPEEENETYIFDGNRIVFLSEELGIESFYHSGFTIVFWAKTNEAGNILQFEVVKIDSNLEETIICVPFAVEIGAIEIFTRYETSCVSEGEIELEPEDRFGLVVFGVGGDSEYWIKTGHEFTDGYSRMEIGSPEENSESNLPPEENLQGNITKRERSISKGKISDIVVDARQYLSKGVGIFREEENNQNIALDYSNKDLVVGSEGIVIESGKGRETNIEIEDIQENGR